MDQLLQPPPPEPVRSSNSSSESEPEPDPLPEKEFPLLLLPPNALTKQIGFFDLLTVILLSTLSKRCFKTTKTAKYTCSHISLSIDGEGTQITCMKVGEETVFINFVFPDQSIPSQMNLNTVVPNYVNIWIIEGLEVDLTNDTDNVRAWIDHFVMLFHQEQIDLLTLGHSDFTMDSIKETFNNIRIRELFLLECLPRNEARTALQSFQPSGILNVFPNPFLGEDNVVDKEGMKQFLFQNRGHLLFGRQFTIPLDEMLLCKATFIEFTDHDISAKNLNKFIKMWIHGSIPDMEYLSISFPNNRKLNETVLFKGIQFDKLGDAVRRTKNLRYDPGNDYEAQGGYEIRDLKHRRATIILEKNEAGRTVYFFKMVIWTDSD